jgi:serine/threonine protein phosphatase PrpC
MPNSYSIAGFQGDNSFFDLTKSSDEASYCAAEVQGGRPSQEDAILIAALNIGSPADYFKESYLEMQKVAKDTSGTTAAMYYLDPDDQTITTANLGDSRVYLTISHPSVDGVVQYVTILLTQDHDLKLKRVKNHVENGGTISERGRVLSDEPNSNRSLNLGGVIGDLHYHSLLRSPDIATFKIADLLTSVGVCEENFKNCEFTITNACDGLTNHSDDVNYEYWVNFDENDSQKNTIEKTINLTAESLSNVIRKGHEVCKSPNLGISGQLIKWAEERDACLNKGSDNISISTLSFGWSLFHGEKKAGTLGAIFDGHGGNRASLGCLKHMKQKVQKSIKTPPGSPRNNYCAGLTEGCFLQ